MPGQLSQRERRLRKNNAAQKAADEAGGPVTPDKSTTQPDEGPVTAEKAKVAKGEETPEAGPDAGEPKKPTQGPLNGEVDSKKVSVEPSFGGCGKADIGELVRGVREAELGKTVMRALGAHSSAEADEENALEEASAHITMLRSETCGPAYARVLLGLMLLDPADAEKITSLRLPAVDLRQELKGIKTTTKTCIGSTDNTVLADKNEGGGETRGGVEEKEEVSLVALIERSGLADQTLTKALSLERENPTGTRKILQQVLSHADAVVAAANEEDKRRENLKQKGAKKGERS